jgi:glycosyl transferase family 87
MFEANLVFPLLAAHVAYAQGLVWPRARRLGCDGAVAVLGAGLVGSTLLMVHDDAMYYAASPKREVLDTLLQWTPIGAWAVVAAAPWRDRVLGRVAYFAAAMSVSAALVVAHARVIEVSPTPHIDVWTSSQRAVGYLLAGKNPYPQKYDDIYHGLYDYRPGMPYWPGYLLWAALGVVAVPKVHDVRVSLVVAELLAAFFLYGFLRRSRVRADIGVLAVAVWLAFPVNLFIFEQAWIDPLLVACFAGAAWALSAERPIVAGVALGYACGTKQYALFGALLAVAHAWRAFGLRGALRLAAATSATALALVGPFLPGAAREFYRSSVTVPASLLPRLDALTVPAYFARRRMPFADAAALNAFYAPFAWVGLAAFALTVLWLLRRRGAPTTQAWLAGCAAAYGFMLMFAKQAFCNYYYFMAFFVLSGAISALGQASAIPVSGGRGPDTRGSC